MSLRPHLKQEKGYTMVIVLVLMTLTAFVVREALKRTAESSAIIEKTRGLTKTAVQVESALIKVLEHLQFKSEEYGYLFGRDAFYTGFQRVDSPAYGSNDTTSSQVVTTIYVSDTSDIPMLNNDPDLFGAQTFPISTNPISQDTYDFSTYLPEIDFGGVKVRLSIIGAIAENPAGDTPPKPTTEFRPIIRIDAMSGLSHGPHIYAIVEGYPQVTESEVGDDLFEEVGSEPVPQFLVSNMLFRVRQITTSYR